MRDRTGPPRAPRCRLSTRALLLYTLLLLGTACVEWRPVPSAAVSARPLPLWVQVTTRDSVHYMLKDAQVVPGDTLVGRPANAASSVRIPVAEIAHLEARVHDAPHSIALLAIAVAGAYLLLARLAPST